jgi:hypothetical protein
VCTLTVPASAGEALGQLEFLLGYLADLDAAEMPAEAVAECLRGLERADAVGAAARGGMLAAFDVKGGHLDDGQRTSRTWLVHSTRVTRGQAAEHKAVQALAQGHGPRTGLDADRAPRRHQPGQKPTGKIIRSHSPPPRPG